MSANILTTFTIPAASTMYTAMYVQPCSKLKLLFDISTSSTVGSITITNGYGGPDSNITFPWNQPIPLVNQLNSYNVTSPIWSLDLTSYSPTTLTGNHQQLEVVIDRAQGAQWLGITIPANASTTVNILGVTY